MRTFLIIVILICSNYILYPQINKGQMICDLTGIYKETKNSLGSNISGTYDRSKSKDFKLKFGYSLTNSMLVGIGIGYSRLDKIINTNVRDYYLNNTLYETTKTKSKTITSGLFIKYYRPLTEKFYFNTCLSINIDFIETNQSNVITQYSTAYIGTDANNNNMYSVNSRDYNGINRDIHSEPLYLELQPEFLYFLTQHFGFILKLGGLRKMHEDDLKDGFKDGWEFDISPTAWNYGFVLKFGQTK